MKPNDKKNKKKFPFWDPFESNREINQDEGIKAIPRVINSQIFGNTNRHYSGEIHPGEQVAMPDVYSGKRESEEKLRMQLILERRLRQEESVVVEKKVNELKLQLQAITEEITKIAKSTPKLSQEVAVATFQAPQDPGVYHVFFFARILEFVRGFRINIEESVVWLQNANSRANKKNYWARYKKSGGSFLLSGEHYLQRSAG